MNGQPFQFLPLGSSGFLTTNAARIASATTTTLVAAPSNPASGGVGAGNTAIAVYQIDCDNNGATPAEVIIGDNAVGVGDRIFFDTKVQQNVSNVYPVPLICRPGKALVVKTTGTVDTWVRITYQLI